MFAPFVAALVLASSCTAGETRATFSRFVAAYNGGDTFMLDMLFAPEPEFKWYSSNPPGRRVGAAAFKRSTLMSYFRARHVRGDRLRLLSFRFNGVSGGYGHFSYQLERRARDFRSGRKFRIPGKGALSCTVEPKAFAVMSLGGPRPSS